MGPTTDTTDMPDLMLLATDHMDTQLTQLMLTERDPLMLSQRLMPTTDTTDMPDLMLLATDHTDTQLTELMLTERDLLMLSQRLMLMLMSMDTHMLLDMLDMPMELTH